MPPRVRDPELFGVTESSFSLFFRVEGESGPVDAEARVLVDGECRATSEGTGTRSVRVEGLAADAEHRIEIDVAGAPPVAPDRYFAGVVRTRSRPAPGEGSAPTPEPSARTRGGETAGTRHLTEDLG